MKRRIEIVVMLVLAGILLAHLSRSSSFAYKTGTVIESYPVIEKK